jgi:DNA-binding NtrC family response regulator
VLEEFRKEPWPGNIRQLRNVLERAMIIAGQGTITVKHLSQDRPAPSEAARKEPEPDREGALRIRVGPPMREVEKAYIDMVLKHTNGNKTKAAMILGLSIRTLHNRFAEDGERSPNASVNATVS